jgi:hypothetical protein
MKQKYRVTKRHKNRVTKHKNARRATYRIHRSKMQGGLYYSRELRELNAFDYKPDFYYHDKFLFNNHQRIDYDWMEQQIVYLNQCSTREKHIVYIYTIYGDKFANYYLRQILTPEMITTFIKDAKRDKINPFQYQHQDKTGNSDIDDEYMSNIMEYIPQYIQELTEIIQKSPRPTKAMTVYRGIMDDSFLKQQQNGMKFYYYIEKGFMSTSFRVESAVNFLRGKPCCIIELEITPYIPCLLTGHLSRRRGEYEITLAPSILMKCYKYNDCKFKYPLVDPEHYTSITVFDKPDDFDLEEVCTYEMRLQTV